MEGWGGQEVRSQWLVLTPRAVWEAGCPGPGSPFTASESHAGRSRSQRSYRAGWRHGAGPLPELQRERKETTCSGLIPPGYAETAPGSPEPSGGRRSKGLSELVA